MAMASIALVIRRQLMPDYTLIWDQRFVKPLREFAPMNYTAPPPIRVAEVTQDHVNEVGFDIDLLVAELTPELHQLHHGWLVRSTSLTIQNDILGQVDNAHLANSDKLTPFNQKCLRLSEIHSVSHSDGRC